MLTNEISGAAILIVGHVLFVVDWSDELSNNPPTMRSESTNWASLSSSTRFVQHDKRNSLIIRNSRWLYVMVDVLNDWITLNQAFVALNPQMRWHYLAAEANQRLKPAGGGINNYHVLIMNGGKREYLLSFRNQEWRVSNDSDINSWAK